MKGFTNRDQLLSEMRNGAEFRLGYYYHWWRHYRGWRSS